MRRTGLAAGVAAFALALCGCGASSPNGAATQVPVDAGGGFQGGAVGDATEPLLGPVFPLTLHRTGGIAGYDDRIVIRADGAVLVDTRSIRGRECRLTTDQQKQMLSLLGTLRLVTGSSSSSDGSASDATGNPTAADTGTSDDERNDAIVITITDDKERPVDLSDPSLGEVAGLVGALVADVTLSSPAATKCTTPTPPVSAPPT
jgi:hypothetical protein